MCRVPSAEAVVLVAHQACRTDALSLVVQGRRHAPVFMPRWQPAWQGVRGCPLVMLINCAGRHFGTRLQYWLCRRAILACSDCSNEESVLLESRGLKATHACWLSGPTR